MTQGDVFWVDLGDPVGSAPGYLRPCIVVQNNVFNRSQIKTVLVCSLTTNLRLASAYGNVLLRKGEANLPKECVAIVSQIITIDRSLLAQRIGRVSAERVREILLGIHLVIDPIVEDEG